MFEPKIGTVCFDMKISKVQKLSSVFFQHERFVTSIIFKLHKLKRKCLQQIPFHRSSEISSLCHFIRIRATGRTAAITEESHYWQTMIWQWRKKSSSGYRYSQEACWPSCSANSGKSSQLLTWYLVTNKHRKSHWTGRLVVYCLYRLSQGLWYCRHIQYVECLGALWMPRTPHRNNSSVSKGNEWKSHNGDTCEHRYWGQSWHQARLSFRCNNLNTVLNGSSYIPASWYPRLRI